MYELKDGVRIFMTPAVSTIIGAVDDVLHEYNLHAIITSGNEGRHSMESKHQYNGAIDFRIWNWPAEYKELVEKIREKLGKDFDVVMEPDHLHVEYDPK